MRRINFFVAGVQKSGTTALDTFLREHSSLQMASIKEVHFFDNEQIDWEHPDYQLLHDKFDWSDAGTLRGEATPIYTYWPDSLYRLKAYNADARLIVGLRHPVFRAYSHWRMEATRKADDLPFAKAIREGRERVKASPGGVHRVYSYVERGHYDVQVRRLLSLFPRSQVHFFRTDHLFDRSAEVLCEVERFLGVPQILSARRRYIVPVVSEDMGEMSIEDRHYLSALFAPCIAATQQLTGLELSDWVRDDYREPMGREAG